MVSKRRINRARLGMAIGIVGLCLSIVVPQAPAALNGVEHVVVVGCDGMSPDGVQKADTPVMHRMMQTGAYTLKARGVMPTSSSPNWASMIMGAGPEQHGITSNDWKPDKFEIAPIAVGPGGIFPTIFSVLREQRPQGKLAVFHHWDDFKRLLEWSMVDKIENSKTAEKTMENTIAYIQENKPLFTFIQLDHVDHAGHEFGHGTAQYYESVHVADQLIGNLLQALHSAKLTDTTIVLVTSDHGGKNKGHGGATMEEIEIPWIIAGPGVVQNKEIKTPVNVYDTAVTLAYIFGVNPPACWIGKPVLEAFKNNE